MTKFSDKCASLVIIHTGLRLIEIPSAGCSTSINYSIYATRLKYFDFL